MYWTKAMSEDSLKRILSNSLCFGVYALPESSSEIAGQSLRPLSSVASTKKNPGRASPTQIGLGRVITDQSTFAYLTDVFVLPEYRGRGLGKWMMQCMKEEFDSWPDLRGSLLYTSGEHAKKFYKETLGMKKFVPGVNGLEIMVSKGPGSVFKDV